MLMIGRDEHGHFVRSQIVHFLEVCHPGSRRHEVFQLHFSSNYLRHTPNIPIMNYAEVVLGLE